MFTNLFLDFLTSQFDMSHMFQFAHFFHLNHWSKIKTSIHVKLKKEDLPLTSSVPTCVLFFGVISIGPPCDVLIFGIQSKIFQKVSIEKGKEKILAFPKKVLKKIVFLCSSKKDFANLTQKFHRSFSVGFCWFSPNIKQVCTTISCNFFEFVDQKSSSLEYIFFKLFANPKLIQGSDAAESILVSCREKIFEIESNSWLQFESLILKPNSSRILVLVF